MSKPMRFGFAVGLAVVWTVVFVAGRSVAGGIEDALDVDALTAGETLPAPAPAAVEPVAAAAQADVSMPAVEGAVAMEAAGTSRETGLLLEALQRKEDELRAARREIARLTDLLRRGETEDRRDQVAVLYNLGCVYRAGGHYDKAEKAFLKALELNDADAALHYNLAILYDDDLGRKDKARTHYERFLELAPKDKDAPRVIEWLHAIMP
jgi:tetratricopeptide (TPR) repeat protein